MENNRKILKLDQLKGLTINFCNEEEKKYIKRQRGPLCSVICSVGQSGCNYRHKRSSYVLLCLRFCFTMETE